ncbi:MAG: hypothetical protein QOG84_316 [Sphingomonadales bacterium]|nr:hypothetical protein [Sphingomonadales bacterium]
MYRLMLPILAATLAAAQPARPASGLGPTARVFATIGHSEFCPAGNVRLDILTGRNELTGRAARRECGRRGLERPVANARLDGGRLTAIRAAYRRALAEVPESPECREGKHPAAFVVSDGGTPILVVATGALTMGAPDDLSCWSAAANALGGALDDSFRDAHQR